MVNIKNMFFLVLIFSFSFVTIASISIGVSELWDDISPALKEKTPEDWFNSLINMDPEEITLYAAFYSLVFFCLLLGIREIYHYLRSNFPSILIDISEEEVVEPGDKKIIAVIPAFNEQKTIREVIQNVRKYTNAIVVVNDGSTDDTGQIAIEEKTILINHNRNRGLGETMGDGITAALKNGADIIVTIDADGQYRAEEIPILITPIISGKADFVMGSRLKGKIEKMPRIKRWGNVQFTKLLRYLSGVGISDGQTGFRALSREAAKHADISAGYTYTQEMILKLAAQGYRFAEVPIHFDKRISGESRLMTGPFNYAVRAMMLLLKTIRDYHPLRLFGSIGLLLIIAGVILGEYVAIGWFQTGIVEAKPSLIIAVMLIISGIQVLIFGLLADAIKELKTIKAELKE